MSESSKGKLIQRANRIAIHAGNATNDTALYFETDWGMVTVVLDEEQLGLLFGMIVQHATGATEHKTGEHDITVNFDPMLTQAMAIADGPTPDTGYVSMLLGRGVNLTFVVDKSALRTQCANVAS